MFFLLNTTAAASNEVLSIFNLLREEIFTQNICNILGCLSFLGTAYLFICRWINERKNLEVSIIDHTKVFAKVIQFFISFQNRSTNPLTIHSVAIIHNGKEYPCELISKKIRGKDENGIKTPMFPINLSPQQGYLCFLEFLFAEEIPIAAGKTVELRIHTNRGPINKQIILNSTAHYLHIVPRY